MTGKETKVKKKGVQRNAHTIKIWSLIVMPMILIISKNCEHESDKKLVNFQSKNSSKQQACSTFKLKSILVTIHRKYG